VQATRPLDEETNKQLIEVLRAIEIKIPPEFAGGKEATSNLLSISYNNKDTLINGVTNHISGDAIDSFYYFNIFPKLQAHGLADNEKVAGARYRRSFLNKAGRALFAEMEKRSLLAKKSKKSASKEGG
jgi:hypothetical protein